MSTVDERPTSSLRDDELLISTRISLVLAEESKRNAINMGLSMSAYIRLSLSQMNFECQKRLVERSQNNRILNELGEVTRLAPLPPRISKPSAFKRRTVAAPSG